MTDVDEFVTRPTRQAAWNLIRGNDVVAGAHGLCRADGRWFVSIDAWDEPAGIALLGAVSDDLRHDLHTMVDEDDRTTLERWQRFGFTVARREIEFALPVDPRRTGLHSTPRPEGVALVSADEVDEALLRRLDDVLRTDVPGSEGWRNDPAEFREYTFDERRFDPETYLVAVDDTRHTFAGLARVWVAPGRARLGLIGVVREYRHRGLARALLAAAFRTLPDRGITTVAAEVDATNAAALALFDRIGAQRTGTSVELVRRSSATRPRVGS